MAGKQESKSGGKKGGGKGKGADDLGPRPDVKHTPRMYTLYHAEAVPKLMEQFEIKNPMALPRLSKIVLLVGMGKSLEGAKLNPAHKDQVIRDLTVISGQRPVMIRARKSVSNFKVRQGMESGCMVTLRRACMWEFFDRLVSISIPRIKDFRGLPTTSFDKQGNYAFGVTEQAIFPEVDTANIAFQHGMHLIFNFSNSNPEKSKALMTALGFPFRKAEEAQKGKKKRRAG
jgi:large subunit ribosomal protein L5